MRNRKINRLSGAAVLEAALLVLATVSLARLTIFNLGEYRRGEYDRVAYAEYYLLKNSLYRILDQHGEPAIKLVIFNQRSSDKLSAPLQHLTLAPGVQLDMAVALNFNGFFRLAVLQIGHESGTKRYRLIDLNGKVSELVLKQ